jgi:site-specific recombinase XerD
MEYNDVPEFLNNFANYLIAIKNLTKGSVTIMITTIKQFMTYINVHKLNNKYENIKNFEINDIRSIVNSDIYGFIYFLAENEYAKATRISKIEYLRTFYDYLFRIQHKIFQEPFKKIKRERFNKNKLPNYLSLKEAKKLLNAYEKDKDPIKIRDNAMLHIFLNCGLRVSEVSNLKLSDINFETNTFRIIGKGNKERIGYINDITRKALMSYLKIRNNIITDKKNKDYLFLNRYNIKINSEGIRKLIKTAYDYVGLDSKKYSVHTLRHTCATILYRAGIGIRTIQEILGHVQVDTTEIYTHLYDKEVMNAIAGHPLAKFLMKNAKTYAMAS